jgi:fructose-1,6-bisphosphatase
LSTPSSSWQENCIVNVCQPGKDMRAAGYCLYSSSTVLVLTIGNGVFGFTLDPMVGEFVLTHPNVKIPEVREQTPHAFVTWVVSTVIISRPDL